ncbi:endonuclease III [Candidatus Saccharibacteria bacterium]|nr:MAG: endonuclease III [Candidatus Saccharibacteria bacterium]
MHDTKEQQITFLKTLWSYYQAYGRHDLPWRVAEPDGSFDPYKILVSELMLQQTQVARVVPKYAAFLQHFPSVECLAAAPLGDVLCVWQGLGYNRRAKFLWHAAKAISTAGEFPVSTAGLMKLPGVGANTAGAIMAYAYNKPAVFVETNIRTVYIHHFAQAGEIVSDDFVRAALTQTLDHEHPREFYWALMDYGTHLKSRIRNIAQSKHYTKQSKFHGSKRQIRGTVIRLLSEKPMTLAELRRMIADDRCEIVLEELLTEGLIRYKPPQYTL